MKITSYEVLGRLPDLFTFDDGRKVRSVADWELRREELKKTVIEMQYGQILPEPEFLEIDPLCLPNTTGRMNIWRITTGTRKHPISYTIYAHKPAGNGPYPIVIDGDLCYGCMQNPEIAKKFTDHGIMLVTFNRCEIVPDIRNPKRTGNLYETYSEYTFGALMAWAWGFIRTLDAVIQLGLADLSSITYTGLSRGGKTALWSAVQDERISGVLVNNSGCTGAAVSRGKNGEVVASINAFFPHWFCPNYAQYGWREEEMPFDQHMLVAAMAPRLCYVTSGSEDSWSDPQAEWLGAAEGSVAWKLFDETVALTEQPGPGQAVQDYRIGYHQRQGGHALTKWDWAMFLQFLKRHGA